MRQHVSRLTRRLSTGASLLLAATLAGCAAGGREPSASTRSVAAPGWPHAVTYQVFVHAFADGDGDGIGDLRGLIAKLDYIRDLGAKAIWLLPIHPSPSYHKYDVTDYRAIHPDYGTMADFETLLREAHARDMRVVIDFVVNHTAREHPWFQAAVSDTASHFHDFYVWASDEAITSAIVERTGPDSDNVRRWHRPEGHEKSYYGYFWAGMPDLNFDNPAVRDSIFEIGRFWLAKGVDGFRLDAARHIFEDGREADNHAFWEAFRTEMERSRPDVLLIGEVWAPTDLVTPYLRGLRSLFNFDMADAIVQAVRTGRGRDLARRHAEIRSAYEAVAGDFVDATFLTNHDQNRVLSVLDEPAAARVAASLLLTLPGAPYIYYGEEIGMRGLKPDPHIREPFLWASPPDEHRTSWIVPRHSTDATVVPMDVQARSDTSLLAHYRRLIGLRNAQPALSAGALEPIDASDDRVVAFLRTHESGSLLVLHNLGATSATVSLPATVAGYRRVVYGSHPGSGRAAAQPSLAPRATVVLGR